MQGQGQRGYAVGPNTGALASMPEADVDTLTQKSLRIDQKSHALMSLLGDIRNRVISGADVENVLPEPPVPDHAVFALESAERKLDRAVKLAHEILVSL